MSLLNNLEIKEKTVESSPHTSSFLFRYLPPTMGLSIGNFLRRILLTSLKGIAPIGIEISDKDGPITSQFTTLAGVVETTPYLILNCKKIILEVKEKKEEEVYCLELDIDNKKDEEYTVTASDFQVNPRWEIKNPDLYLATLAPSSHLQIKLYFRESVGYHQATEQKKHLLEKENVIVFDIDYSPIKGDGVNFQVNEVVRGMEKKEEELTLTITTTGAISPKKALTESLKIIKQTTEIIQEKLSK